jgi:FlaA1/EpsC-like NDP-sugar epimerase
MSTAPINIEGKTVLVTGANRGLGKALVEEALSLDPPKRCMVPSGAES